MGITELRQAWIGLPCALALQLVAGNASADFVPDSSVCKATVGDAGGQDASFDLETNSAFSQADGGFLQLNDSHAEVGIAFTSAMTLPASLSVGVTFAGLLVGSLGINTTFGFVHISVILRDETEGTTLDVVDILDQKEDGAAFQTNFTLVESNQFDPPVATFPNVEFIAGHDYTVTLSVVTTARGLQGEADFKTNGRFVRFGCMTFAADLADSDGDGLYDVWEENGIDVDDDGNVEIDLPSFGANPNHKDLFIELDWRPGRQPTRASIQALKEVFALAPADAGGTLNPDNQPGINLWVDTGAALENGLLIGDDLGGGGDVVPDPVTCLEGSFYAAKAEFFDPIRLIAFRYGISANSSNDENRCSNGQAVGGKGEVGGNDFVVYNSDAGYILHEFGHNLKLDHGGFEDLNNKPNYVSMMNYNYGLNIPQFGSDSGILDYAPPRCATCPGGRGAIPTSLDETALDETLVLDANDTQNMFQFRDTLARTTNLPMSGGDANDDAVGDIDWDGDSNVSVATVSTDINEDGKCVLPGSNGTMETATALDDVLLSDVIIHDGDNRVCNTTANPFSNDVQNRSVGAGQPDVFSAHDDWSNIRLNLREFGDSADAPINEIEERSLEELRAVDEAINTTDLELSMGDAPDPVNAGEPLVYTLTLLNHGRQPARGIRVLDELPPEAIYVSDSAGCEETTPGSLRCELATLPAGESGSLQIMVVVPAEAVANLPAPAIVQNSATVENRVPYGVEGNLGEIGGDPDLSNNAASATTTINRPPVSDPNGPYLEECQGAMTVLGLDGSGSYDPDGDPITYAWSTDCPDATLDDPHAVSPLLSSSGPPPCPVACGATLTVTDPMGLWDTAVTAVTIQDTTPPDISVTLAPTTLWPPNHGLVGITATVSASDICDPSPAVALTSITSDEPDDAPGGGDGNTQFDIQGFTLGTADTSFQLRAERAGTGDGRTYTVTYAATDACGLTAPSQSVVSVPHNQ
jgi:uncharacterized repeat protein (TIGR01451 family)